MATFAVLASLCAAEAATTVEFDRWTAFHRRPPHVDVTFRAGPDLFPGVNGDARYRTSSLGIRGPELPATRRAYRILCVGGSATECVYLDDARSWPFLLMQRLNSGAGSRPVWVGNVGISGFTSAEHLVFVMRSALINQVDCALFLVGFNDAGRVLIGAGETGPAPLWRRSALFLLTLEAVRRHSEKRLIDHIDEVGDNIRLKRIRRQAAPKTDRLPDFGAALNDYAARLREIVARCREKGVRPVLVAQPALYDRHLSAEVDRRLWLGENPDGAFVVAGRLREALDAYSATLRAVCRESNVDCVDLSDMSGHPEFFFDDCHFNEAGAREVTRRLADYLENAGRR